MERYGYTYVPEIETMTMSEADCKHSLSHPGDTFMDILEGVNAAPNLGESEIHSPQHIFRPKNDVLMEAEVRSYCTEGTFDNIEWEGYDLPQPEKHEKPQLSAETYEYLREKGKPQIVLSEVADIIQEQLELKRFADQIYYYDGRIWCKLLNSEELRSITGSFLNVQELLSKNQFAEIFSILRSRWHGFEKLEVDSIQIQQNICFLNGVYNIEEDIMVNHSPDYPFLSYLPYEFHPGDIGKGENFDRYLDSVSHGNADVRMRILQWIGYCISNLPNLKKIALLIGERDSGKTTLARVIASIVGDDNVQAFDLNHITQFSNDEMFGKKVGLCTDLKGSRLPAEALEWLKCQTGGDVVLAAVKHNRNSYSYISSCKFMIASNFRPDLGEDDALENRFLTIPFPKSIADADKNLNLVKDIRHEMQHVFYLAFDALRKFMDAGMQFADIGELEYYIPKHFSNEDSTVGDFFRECCYLDEKEKTRRKDAYECYSKYCAYNGKKTLNEATFYRGFKKIMDENGIKDDTNHGRRYSGLALRRDISEQ